VRYLTLLILGTLVATAVAGSSAAADSAKPSLKLTNAQPLTIRGTSFHARERVRVVLRPASGAATTKRVRAGRHGSFTTTFASVQLSRCAAFQVTAQGSNGSRATLRRPPLPACMPA
jgi:hypothetical protein